MAGRAGLKKVQKTVRGKRGSVKRSYWVKSNPDARGAGSGRKSLKSAPPKQEGFLSRHKGKIAAGLAVGALAGAALLNKHKISGSLAGVRSGYARSQAFGSGKTDTALSMFRKAKEGWNANASRDTRANALTAHAGRGVAAVRGRAAEAGKKATAYRRTHGAALAEHLTNVGGEAAAHHIGSKFGSVAGTSLGGMAAGPVGAGIGGFLGGHAGGFLANRHTAPHIARGATKLAEWMRR